MIGRLIEEEGQKVIQTLAGATAGTVCKVNYGVDCNYAIPITPNEVGEGYVGVSCVCPGPYYNPATGTLTVCNVCAKSSEAENADKVKSNSLTGDTVYNMAMWCATSDGCYNSIGFSGGRSITYNPYTATLTTCCGNFANSLSADDVHIGSTLRVDNGIVVSNANADIGEITSNGTFYWSCGTCFTDACITNLTVTNKIDGTACKAEGTTCWNQYCLDYMSGSADRPILMTSAPDTNVCSQVVAGIGRSTNCSFTYNPNTGVLKRCGGEMAGYTLSLDSANGGTKYALIDIGSANGNLVEGKIYSNTFSLVKYCGGDAIYRHSIDDYGTIAVGHINNTTTCVWIRYSAWIPMELFGQKPIKLVCSTTTPPSGITFVNSNSSVSVASYATSACIHCRVGYNGACDFHIALESGNSTTNSQTYVSTACCLRYCTSTGALRITSASGCSAGCIIADQIIACSNGINTYYDINGFCDDENHTHSWYIYCDGSACFNCDVCVCGNLEQNGCDVLTARCLAPLGICKFSVSANTLVICSR